MCFQSCGKRRVETCHVSDRRYQGGKENKGQGADARIQRQAHEGLCHQSKGYDAAVINKKQKDGLVDVVVNAADAAKVNRIAERFALSTVDVEKIREEIQKSREEREQKREQEQKDKDLEPKETDKQDAKSDSEDNPIKEFKYPEPKEPEQPNPTKEGTSQSPSHSAITFGLLNSERKIKSDRPSVREQIRKMREERKQAAAEKQTPTRDKAQAKRGTKPKTKTKSTKGR